MKKTKKILSIFLAVLMVMSSFAFSSSAINAETQEVAVGESSSWDCTPMGTYSCARCGGVFAEAGASQLGNANITVVEGDESVINGNADVYTNSYGEKYIAIDYTGLKAGTVTFEITFDYIIGANGNHRCKFCGNLNYIKDQNIHTTTAYLTINVVENATYTVTREYYVDGAKVASADVDMEGKVGDVINGLNLAAANSSWSNYTVNGAAVNFPCVVSDPASITLVSDAAANSLTLKYYNNHVDADGDGKCDNCGADTDAHKHAWDEGKVTENATCDKDGVMTYTCACGETKTEAIQKTCDGTCGCTNAVNNCGGDCADNCACKKACDHTNVTFTDNGDGTHDGVCDNCKVTVADNEKHADNDGDYKCDKCGANVCPGHVDVNGDGKCDNCGADTDAHKHAWDEGKVTENATCDKDGVMTYTCACGETKTEAIKKTCDGTCGCTNAVNNCGGDCADNCACKKACDHTNVTFTDNGDGTHDGVCDNCKATVADNEEHADTDGDYYCDKCAANMCPGHVDVNGDGKCDNCGVDTDVHQHIWDDGKITKSATCDEDGVITYTCACGAKETTTITKRCNGVCGCTDGVKICDGDCAANCACKKDCEHANVTFKDNGDGTHDGVCDTCKAVVVDNEKHADNDKDNKCDKCGADLSTTDPTKPTDPDHKHVDKDGDGYCDECGNKMPIIDGNCDCICHRRGKIWKVFFKLYVVVWKLFGINTVCKCGNYHYTR